MPIFWRQQIVEQIIPVVLSVLGIIVIFTSGLLLEIGSYVIAKKVPVLDVCKMLAFKLPIAWITALPIGTLFGAMFALGRLAKDRELLIYLVSGVSCQKLVAPYLLVSLLFSMAAFGVNEWLVPSANKQGDYLMRKIIYESVSPEFLENIFFKDKDRCFYVGKVVPELRELHNVNMYQFSGNMMREVITAKIGYFEDDTWILYNGMTYKFDDQGAITRQLIFDQVKINMEQKTEELFHKQRSAADMSRKELKELIAFLAERGVDTTGLTVEYHAKAALSLATFIFVLSGIPLMVRFWRGGKFVSVGGSLVIATGYFVLMSFSVAAGKAKLISPLWAAWLPNMILFIYGTASIAWINRR